MSTPYIKEHLSHFESLEQVFEFLEVDYDTKFLNEYREPLTKRFNGYLLMEKPDDWFATRRLLEMLIARYSVDVSTLTPALHVEAAPLA
ncbi:conserved hypothetical protein [Vibrio ishigakensis]|uniref:Nitrogenase-stabilizing/protective protein NifW n=1 Tax=Vibrio ishigakensis TaxID=1481914 RepID=A0A0B8QRU3_9VIBR|nr:conserved hypothetical protein [Vibrio ishigakensis]